MRNFPTTLFLIIIFLNIIDTSSAQKISHQEINDLELIYFGKQSTYLLPHVSLCYANSMDFHRRFWDYHGKHVNVLLNDFEDMGHAGALAMPFSQVQLGIEPYGFAFSIVPSNERFQWLFNHELTHIVMSDKANKQDETFRKIFCGKIRRSEEKPVSALWSYLTTPRWYSPRWYQEGIACFMETWMSGGLGRAMGTYDEMYFRSIVNEQQPIYSLVGLETEGTTIDFQVGTNAYLYGTRFITYLAYQYGIDSLKAFYSRTNDSKAFYAAQFKKVYGRSIREVWDEWIQWEYRFQEKNIERIKEYPLTTFKSITDKPLGSVSKFRYNPGTGKIYAAINYPGTISQIAEIDMSSGEIRKIATLDSPLLYMATSFAYNPADEKIYISEQNNKYRSLVEVDVHSGKKKTLIPMSRTGDLVYNKADGSLWGVRHTNGYAGLVMIPKPYNKVVPMFTPSFGKVIFDLDISNDGKKLSASLSGIRGEQSLLLFDLEDLKAGISTYETIHQLEDNTLTQFKFSSNDQYLIGTSYYTGVSNVWRIELSTREFELLSNTETGLFMPLQIDDDSLMVLKFYRDGMLPGIIPIEVLDDANAINYLGNLVHQKHPHVEEWSLPPASSVQLDSAKIVHEGFSPIKEMKLANAYPDIAGYKGTVALGYRLNWRDAIGISDIDLFIAGSPWSNYEDKQKIHASIDWRFWNWTFSATYNKTHFYDLFGPTKRSRAGYSAGMKYKRKYSIKKPQESFFEFNLFTYGDLEVLPQYQNIASPIKSIHAATITYGTEKLRKTLGAVIDEKGYEWNATASNYLAKGDWYPSIISNQNFGVLIPGIRNTSFWIRNSIGQSMGDRNSGLSHFYFGGFRNNYVDWQPSEQYREVLAFPGAKIDEIQAYNYVKTMGELNLKPIRLRNVGTSWLYPTFIKTSVFGTHLMTNFDKQAEIKHLFNAGGQIDIQLVLFSYLKTTWSVGYAQKFENRKDTDHEFMLSLKLLGN